MTTNIQKWFLILAMWAVILFSIFAFYWVFVRPVKVRRICAARANQLSSEIKSGNNLVEINRAIYLDCLRCNGVEK